MIQETKHNLTHLADFGGRDARATFWYYVLFLFLAYFVLSFIGGFVLIGSVMGPMIETAGAGGSEQEIQARMTLQMGDMMGRMMRTMVWVSVVVSIVMDLLLAASFVRRLHDSNSSGWWALAVLASQIAGIAAMIPMIDVMQDFMAQAMDPANMENPAFMKDMFERQSQMFGYSAVGWIGTLILIVFGVLPSTEGPNRFGEAPVRF